MTGPRNLADEFCDVCGVRMTLNGLPFAATHLWADGAHPVTEEDLQDLPDDQTILEEDL